MSRIGKKPITIPSGVEIEIADRAVSVRGPLGSLSVPVPDELRIEREDAILRVTVARKTKQAAALWGLTRALLANAIEGVTKGYVRRLVLEGIGYTASMAGTTLVLSLGFSHPVSIVAPEGIRFSVDKNIITISGFDKQLVGHVAASIRALRKPEPYKGKGIHREGEVIRRKAGKKAAVAAK